MADIIELTSSPVIEELEKMVKDKGSKKAVAENLGISAQHLGDILGGRRSLGKDLLEKLGYVKVTVHVKAGDVPIVLGAIQMAQTKAEGWQELKHKIFDGRTKK